MGDGDDSVVLFGQLLVNLLGGDGGAPFGAQDVDVEALALADFDKAVAEEAVADDEDVVAALGGVGDGHFHGQRAGAGEGEGHPAAAEQGAQLVNQRLVVSDKAGIAKGLDGAGHFGADGIDNRGGARDHDKDVLFHE